MKLLIISVFILLIILVIVALLFKRNASKTPYKIKDIMTKNEVEFFNRLRNAVPHHYIFPQVSMAAILSPDMPTRSKQYLGAFRRISQKRIDWAVYTSDLKLICVVELDDSSHNKTSDQIRDTYMSGAGIKTLRWQTKSKPDVNAIAEMINILDCVKPN